MFGKGYDMRKGKEYTKMKHHRTFNICINEAIGFENINNYPVTRDHLTECL